MAEFGGAIDFAIPNVTIRDCLFFNNFAVQYGGALFFTDTGIQTYGLPEINYPHSGIGTSVSIVNSTFHSNSANHSAGAIAFISSSPAALSLSFELVVLWDNDVIFYAGAVLLNLQGAANVISFQSCILSRNFAQNGFGGGLYLTTSQPVCVPIMYTDTHPMANAFVTEQGTQLHAENTTFLQNQANDGGALWAFNQSVIVTLQNCTFIENFLGFPAPLYAGVGMSSALQQIPTH